jgi:tRNA (guanine37-N1)-methyltransferase
MFEAVLGESIIKRARKARLLDIKIHDIRDYSSDPHRKVDDRPYGGGPGMVMNVQPIFHAVNSLKKKSKSSKVILLSPQGKILTHKLAKSLSKNKALILICGHYEGVDERVASLADAEISIGDYILTGGELAAMVLIDSIARFLPGVLGHKDSNREESFSSGLLEYPQYTRPANFKGLKVPAVLLSGDHQAIAKWRKNQALKRTKQKRPDILKEC